MELSLYYMTSFVYFRHTSKHCLPLIIPSEHGRQIYHVYDFYYCWSWMHLHCVIILNLCYTSYKQQYSCLGLTDTTWPSWCALCHCHTCRFSRLWKWSFWNDCRRKSVPTAKPLVETVGRIHLFNRDDSKSPWLVWLLVRCVDACSKVVCQHTSSKKLVFPQIPCVDKHKYIMSSQMISSSTSMYWSKWRAHQLPPRRTIRNFFLRYLKRSHQWQKRWLIWW